MPKPEFSMTGQHVPHSTGVPEFPTQQRRGGTLRGNAPGAIDANPLAPQGAGDEPMGFRAPTLSKSSGARTSRRAQMVPVDTTPRIIRAVASDQSQPPGSSDHQRVPNAEDIFTQPPQANAGDGVREPSDATRRAGGKPAGQIDSSSPEPAAAGGKGNEPPPTDPPGGTAEMPYDDDPEPQNKKEGKPGDTSSTASQLSPADVELRRTIRREFVKKRYFITKFLEEGSLPTTPEGESAIQNAIQIGINSQAIAREDSPLHQQLREYLVSSETPDRFAIQNYGRAFTDVLLEGVDSLDMTDLALAIQASRSVLSSLVAEMNTPLNQSRVAERVHDFLQIYEMGLVQGVDPQKIVGDAILPFPEIYSGIFRHGEKSLNPSESRMVVIIQNMIRDRLIISDLVLSGGLWTMSERRGDSAYSTSSSANELDLLNNRAADTLERLHLLKAYGVTPFEVSGDRVQLPWDIAVVPPLEISEEESHRYAEGAVADFLFLPPDSNRSDILFRYDQDQDQRTTTVSVGDSEPLMRFRLHDNGQVSHGLMYHNTPSDITERTFNEIYSGIAFQRLRALFIALAFDALVPDEVVTGRDVRGSVAQTFMERPNDPPGQRITDLLLRRRKALQKAGVSEGQRLPEGWDGPTKAIDGYLRKLPLGTRARPTAETEAREYFASINVQFTGLPEGYTFVSPYDRRATSEVIYRRARFRKNANTTTFLDSL